MISILIAVYNAERYLRVCLDSLLAQTMTDFEVLCTDDASTDHSLDILRQYEQRDRRIRVFTSDKNHGQAVARNAALREAHGDVIMFLDADDWIDKDALRHITNTFEADADYDAVLFNVINTYPDGLQEPYPMPPFTAISGTEAARRSISWKGIHGVYAIRADIHHRYPYDTTCRSYSDDITSTLHFLHCRQVATSDARYYYRQHDGSVTHSISLRRFDILPAKQQLMMRLRQEAVPDDFHRLAATDLWLWLIDCCKLYYMHHAQLSGDERRQALMTMRHTWDSIPTELVDKRLMRKFGYMHTPAWHLFRLQNTIYFTLRQILGRNK